jgi:carbon-monoxide dehydrogenase medium subunit
LRTNDICVTFFWSSHDKSVVAPRRGLALKLPDVDYLRPNSVCEAVEILAANGGAAKLIAGGQSLMPMLAFRLLGPKLLVDISRIPGLDEIEITGSGLRLGALTTWHAIEQHADLRRWHPLLHAAVGHVAHYQIRNRGTVGGSLAHCDPSAEFPAVVLTCGAEIVVRGSGGERIVDARDFVQGAMTTALADDEIIVQIRFPAWPAPRRWGFEEFARRRGDFAIAAAAVFYDLNEAGRIIDPHVGVIGEADGARRVADVEEFLTGAEPTPALIAQARAVSESAVSPAEDIHAPASYRRALMGVMIERALVASLPRDARV